MVARRPVGVCGGVPGDGRRLLRPVRAVADDARVDGVDPSWLELLDERSGQADDAAVDRADGRRAGVRALLGHAAEEHERGLVVEPFEERVDDLGVPDELERREVQRLVDVVVRDRVLVTVDGGEDEVTHRARRRPTRPRCGADRRGP